MRERAIAVLERDYRERAEQARKREPSAYERSQLAHLERALGELRAMAPEGDLLPRRPRDWMDKR